MLLRENAEDMGLPRNQQGWGKFNCEKLLAGLNYYTILINTSVVKHKSVDGTGKYEYNVQ